MSDGYHAGLQPFQDADSARATADSAKPARRPPMPSRGRALVRVAGYLMARPAPTAHRLYEGRDNSASSSAHTGATSTPREFSRSTPQVRRRIRRCSLHTQQPWGDCTGRKRVQSHQRPRWLLAAMTACAAPVRKTVWSRHGRWRWDWRASLTFQANAGRRWIEERRPAGQGARELAKNAPREFRPGGRFNTLRYALRGKQDRNARVVGQFEISGD
jgi:hypothetical protein